VEDGRRGVVEKFPQIITLEDLKSRPELTGMTLVGKGRLSVQPVEERYWKAIKRRPALAPTDPPTNHTPRAFAHRARLDRAVAAEEDLLGVDARFAAAGTRSS